MIPPAQIKSPVNTSRKNKTKSSKREFRVYSSKLREEMSSVLDNLGINTTFSLDLWKTPDGRNTVEIIITKVPFPLLGSIHSKFKDRLRSMININITVLEVITPVNREVVIGNNIKIPNYNYSSLR